MLDQLVDEERIPPRFAGDQMSLRPGERIFAPQQRQRQLARLRLGESLDGHLKMARTRGSPAACLVENLEKAVVLGVFAAKAAHKQHDGRVRGMNQVGKKR